MQNCIVLWKEQDLLEEWRDLMAGLSRATRHGLGSTFGEAGGVGLRMLKQALGMPEVNSTWSQIAFCFGNGFHVCLGLPQLDGISSTEINIEA